MYHNLKEPTLTGMQMTNEQHIRVKFQALRKLLMVQAQVTTGYKVTKENYTL
jgi:hypothetical protein